MRETLTEVCEPTGDCHRKCLACSARSPGQRWQDRNSRLYRESTSERHDFGPGRNRYVVWAHGCDFVNGDLRRQTCRAVGRYRTNRDANTQVQLAAAVYKMSIFSYDGNRAALPLSSGIRTDGEQFRRRSW